MSRSTVWRIKRTLLCTPNRYTITRMTFVKMFKTELIKENENKILGVKRISLLQAGLIVKLLMKLSGLITPNEQTAPDKYPYG